MQAARMALSMSQKDLAVKINEKQSVLQDIESGRATANPQVLGKIERQLGVKLRGVYRHFFLWLMNPELTCSCYQVTTLERNWMGPSELLLHK
jgi:transcriptional regulator with XRE-family HTH domain